MRQTRGALATFAGSERHQPVHSICCARTQGVNPCDLLVCGTMSGVYAGVAPTPGNTKRWLRIGVMMLVPRVPFFFTVYSFCDWSNCFIL